MPTDRVNLDVPMRFTGSDFAAAEGDALTRAQLLHVLLSEGEMPWRTSFRAALDLLRHRRSDAVVVELIRVRIRDALSRWLPDVALLDVHVAADQGVTTVRIRVERSGITTTVALEVA
jgi:hypothetical protein